MPQTLPFEFGAKVNIDGDKSIQGVVIGICLYPHGIQVEVSWFNNGECRSAWFADWRLSRVAVD